MCAGGWRHAGGGEQEPGKPGTNEGYHQCAAQRHEREREEDAEQPQQAPPLRMFLWHGTALPAISKGTSFVDTTRGSTMLLTPAP